MLRNIRRARRSEHSSQSSNASVSSPSSPETTSSSLPEESVASCSGSETSNTSASECSHSSASSSSSRSSTPFPESTGDGLHTGRCSPDWSHTTTASENPSCTTPPQKPTRSRLRKQSKFTSNRPDPIAGNYTPKSQHRRQGSAHADLGPEREEETLHPVRSILRGAGTDAPKRWVHILNMSLEDLYFGKTFYFRVVRYRRSGRKTVVPLEVYVPPGTSGGTEIVVEGVGNERKDGSMQAILFLVKEEKHERFTRMQEDLLMEVRLPWVDRLNRESGRVYFQRIEGGECMFSVDYHMNGLLSGTTVIPDAGMPLHDGLRRGRVIIRCVQFYVSLLICPDIRVLDGRYPHLSPRGIPSSRY